MLVYRQLLTQKGSTLSTEYWAYITLLVLQRYYEHSYCGRKKHVNLAFKVNTSYNHCIAG